MQGTPGLTLLVLALITYEGNTQKQTKVPWVPKERFASCDCRKDRQNPVCGDNGITYHSMVCFYMCAPAGVRVIHKYPCWVTEEEAQPVPMDDIDFVEGNPFMEELPQDSPKESLRSAILEYRLLRDFQPDSDISVHPKLGLRTDNGLMESNSIPSDIEAIQDAPVDEEQQYKSKDGDVDLDDDPNLVKKVNFRSNDGAVEDLKSKDGDDNSIVPLLDNLKLPNEENNVTSK